MEYNCSLLLVTTLTACVAGYWTMCEESFIIHIWFAEKYELLQYNLILMMSKSKENLRTPSKNSPTKGIALATRDLNLTMHSNKKLEKIADFDQTSTTSLFLCSKEANQGGKKLQAEKKKIRELQTKLALQQQHTKQVQMESQTIKKSLLLQIQMYKQMLREQEDEKTRYVHSIQTAFNEEVQRMIGEHEGEFRQLKNQRQIFQRKIKQTQDKLQQTESKLFQANAQNERLAQHLEHTKLSAKNMEEKLSYSDAQVRSSQDKHLKEVAQLKQQIMTQKNQYSLQLQNLSKKHMSELEQLQQQIRQNTKRFEEKLRSELNMKSSETRDVVKNLEAQNKFLQQGFAQKQKLLAGAIQDLKLVSEELAKLKKQLQDSGRQNEKLCKQNKEMSIKLQKLEEQTAVEREATRERGSRAQLQKEIDELRRESARLKRQLRNSTHNAQNESDRRYLLAQIKNLKDVLMESSSEMQKCKQEFIRMEREKERLLRLAKSNEDENIRLKATLAERDLQNRKARDSFTSTRNRY